MGITNKAKPWFDDTDPSKPYYGKLSDSEIEFVKNQMVFFDSEGVFTKVALFDFHILLDFEAYKDFEILYPLFRWICNHKKINSNNEIYWFPLGINIDDYNPIMLAKTGLDFSFLEIISASMMQMLNGAYCAADKNGNFLAIFVDGYYLLVALKKEWCVKDINKYLNTWFDLENSCDCYVLGKLNFAKSLYEKAA